MLTLALTVVAIELLTGAALLGAGLFGGDYQACSRDDCRLRDGH
jgi:hypothetical protein